MKEATNRLIRAFSRAYGTDPVGASLPSNELLGYSRLSLRDRRHRAGTSPAPTRFLVLIDSADFRLLSLIFVERPALTSDAMLDRNIYL